MKNSWKFAALIAALAAGSASAAGTAAGTVITNTADIVFTPEGAPTGTPPHHRALQPGHHDRASGA
ncbi:hypothetical protein M8445_04615 [Deinococcus aquaticus]|uniref:Uncharacterized protein n=1 Tax=Deinococcus aquaticus TaxID=328692 RepID=A0ABY7V4H4_9DEIO|nr:hypothetical protein [Deinococcus aquaticus]WDA59499.1 hypothetical protein M8445_04615 [Deinococcus aquaticus]